MLVGYVFYCFYKTQEANLIIIPILLFGIIAFLKPDFIWYSIAFFTPISINPADVDFGKLSLSLPTEPLLVVLVLIFFYYIFYTKEFPKDFFQHPFSILIFAYVLWMFLTCLTSVDKMVSIKYWISKIWFIIPMYFLSYFYFLEKKKITLFISLFLRH